MSAVKPDKATHSLDGLVPRFQGDLWRYVRYLGAESAEAEDLVQETFLAVLRSDFHYRSDAEAFAYLRTTARRQLLVARRSKGRELNKVGLESAEQVWANMESTVGGWDEYLAALQKCLEHLDGRAREAVELYYKQQMDQTEVGHQLGLEREGVKTLLRRVRQRLRECVQRKVKS